MPMCDMAFAKGAVLGGLAAIQPVREILLQIRCTWQGRAIDDSIFDCGRLTTRGSSEAVGARKAVGDETTGAAAGTEPGAEIGLGAGAVFALPPGEAVGEAKHLGVGETARLVALQDDAAAARHQRDVVELD